MQLLEHTCDVSRNTTTGTNGRRALQPLASGVRCLALPMSAPTAIRNRFDIGKGYDFYFDKTTDVRVKDQLAFGGNTFTVSSVELYDIPVVGYLHAMAKMEIGK